MNEEKLKAGKRNYQFSITNYPLMKDSGIEWIGEIPEHWEVKKFKYFVNLIIEKSNEEMKKIALENIESKTGKYLETDAKFEGEGIRFKIGDILYGKLRPYLAKVLLANFVGAAVGDFFVIRSNNKVLPNFLKFILLSDLFTNFANSSTFGAKMPRVSWDFIANLFFPIPQTNEQTAIANYLDRKTAEIDELIAKKEQLLKLYEEEKTAVINSAVTGRILMDNGKLIIENNSGIINYSLSTINYKDSSIEWLGDPSTELRAGIPAHWEVKKLKYLVSKVGSGITPRGGANVYQLNGIPLLRSQNIHFDGIKLEDVAYISNEIHDEMENSKVCSGDVLINITGASIGRCFYVTNEFDEANVNQHVCILRPNIKIQTKYLYLVLRSKIGQLQIDREQTGSGREGLNFESLKNFYIPLNSIEEQTAIVDHIEKESARIDAKVAKTKKLIDLLKEYRTALISEAVTGKMKIIDNG